MEKGKAYKGVIFDIDGTLINTDLYVVLNYVHMFNKYCPEKMPDLKTLISFSGPSLDAVFQERFKGFDIEDLKKEFRLFCAEHQNQYSSLYEGEEEALKDLKAAGVKMGLVSSKGKSGVISGLEYFHLTSFFSSVFPNERCLRLKPDPWPLLACAEELGLKKEDVLYIGDDKGDLQAARGGGFKVGLVTYGLKSIPSEIRADYYLKSYAEIKEAVLYGKQD